MFGMDIHAGNREAIFVTAAPPSCSVDKLTFDNADLSSIGPRNGFRMDAAGDAFGDTRKSLFTNVSVGPTPKRLIHEKADFDDFAISL